MYQSKALFEVYCAACHSVKGAGGALSSVVLKNAAQGIDDEALARFITEGMPGTIMPSFEKTLTGEQIGDLVAFIRSW